MAPIKRNSNADYPVLTAHCAFLVQFCRWILPVQMVPEQRAQLVSCGDETQDRPVCAIQFCTTGSTIQGLKLWRRQNYN